MNMDRREFLKKAGLGAAVLGIGACAPRVLGDDDAKSRAVPDGKMASHYDGIGLLGYGCMRWPVIEGEDGRSHINQAEVNNLVDYALEHGVNYFDTSPVYLEGDSERATAEALNRHPRGEWLLATKLSNFSDFSYDNSVKMYRKSLEIFKTDHVDYYLLHALSGGDDFKRRFGDTGIMDFLLKERELGHIRNLGFSFHGPDSGFMEMMELQPFYITFIGTTAKSFNQHQRRQCNTGQMDMTVGRYMADSLIGTDYKVFFHKQVQSWNGEKWLLFSCKSIKKSIHLIISPSLSFCNYHLILYEVI